MNLKRCTWALLIGVFVVALIGSFEWSPASASRLGQTVPTRTPTAVPVTPTALPATPTPPPVLTESPAPATDSSAAASAPTPALLPVAGGEDRRPLSSLLTITGVVLLALSGWRWLERKLRQAR